MIRLAALLVLVSLGTVFSVMAHTDSASAITFSFVGAPLLGLGIAVYAYHLWRPVQMTADERALYKLAFEALGAREFLALMVLGHWGEADAGQYLFRQGDRPEEIRVLLSGVVSVEVGGEELTRLGPGQMIGATFILTETEAWGDGVVVEPARFMSWPIATLQRVLEKKPRVRASLNAIVSRDLAEKLRVLTQPGAAP